MGKQEFAKQTPEMLKYQPKRFWSMLRSTTAGSTDIAAKTFADHNQRLYYNGEVTEDKFEELEDAETVKVTAKEVEHVLAHHFKANKSAGLSCMPL